MSRASGRLTGRSSRTSSRNQSRQGTIHPENPDLLNKLLKEDTPPHSQRPPGKDQHDSTNTNSDSVDVQNPRGKAVESNSSSSKPNTATRGRPTSASGKHGGSGSHSTDEQNNHAIKPPPPPSSTTPRKVADRVTFDPKLGPAEDSGTEFPPKDKGGGVSEKDDADSGHFDGNDYILSTGDADTGNLESSGKPNDDDSNDVNKSVNDNTPNISKNNSDNNEEESRVNQSAVLEKREGTFTEESTGLATKNAVSPDTASNPTETYRKPAEDDSSVAEQADVVKSDVCGDVSKVNNLEEENSSGNSTNDINSNNILHCNQPLTRSNSELDRQTLKSTNSFSSELARLHSPSRKSLNIDLSNDQDQQQQTNNNNNNDNDGGASQTIPTQQKGTNPETEPHQISGPAPSVVSPRQSISTFQESGETVNSIKQSTGNSQSLSQELQLKFKLDDFPHTKSNAPYSSQRLKSQGDLAKRSLSVRSDNVPVQEEPEIREKTPIDSLEIEKDSLDVDDEENGKDKINDTSVDVSNSIKSDSVPTYSKSDYNNSLAKETTEKERDVSDKAQTEDKQNDILPGVSNIVNKTNTDNLNERPAKRSGEDFSEDSLTNSLDAKPTPEAPSDIVKENRNSQEFLKDRSDSTDTLVDEKSAVESVGLIEKHLNGPAVIPETINNNNITRRYQQQRNQQPTSSTADQQPGVEFVIRSEPGSRYSSSIPRSRRDSYTNLQRPVQSSTTPNHSARRFSGGTPSRKKVYVESPTFTHEEEGEYRFVKSRLDDLDESGKYNTFRELDTFDVERKEEKEVTHNRNRTAPVPIPRKMPEKRVRYSDLDNEYREKEIAIYAYDGTKHPPGATQNQTGGPTRPAQTQSNTGYGNEFSSTDESDKENRRGRVAGDNMPLKIPQGVPTYPQNRPDHSDPSQNNPHGMPISLTPPPHQQDPPRYQSKAMMIAQQQDDEMGGYGHAHSHLHHGYQPQNMSRAPPGSHSHSHTSHQPQSQGYSRGDYYDQSQNLQQQQPSKVPSPPPPQQPPPQQQQQPQPPTSKPQVRGLSLPTGPTYDPADEDDLEKERSYQQGLKSRIDSANRQAERSVIPPLHLQEGYSQNQNPPPPQYGAAPDAMNDGYYTHPPYSNNQQSFAQDSLDYETEDTARYSNNYGNVPRDSLDTYPQPHPQQQYHDHSKSNNPKRFAAPDDAARYEDRDEYNPDYEHVRGQRANPPQVQPRFYDPSQQQDYSADQLNTDRSDISVGNNHQFRQTPPGDRGRRIIQMGGHDFINNGEDDNNDDFTGHERYNSRVNRRNFYNSRDNDNNMEAAHPSPPKYDYIEHNKGDYGKTPQKSYKRIHEINKEERNKLETAFIHPKPKGKGAGILKKRTGSQNSLNSDQQQQPSARLNAQGTYDQQPYMAQQPEMTDDSGMTAAERVWARRSSTLASRVDPTTKGAKKKPHPGLQKFNSDSSINQVGGPNHGQNYQQLRQAHNQYHMPRQQQQQPPPPPQQQQYYQQQQQLHQSQHTSSNQRPPLPYQQQHHQQQQHAQPQQKVPPRDGRAFLTEMPTPVNEQSSNNQASLPVSPRQEFQMTQPITQQIVTEDGQRISVDVNLKLISPPPSQHQQQQFYQSNNPHHHQQQYHQQHPVHDQHQYDGSGLANNNNNINRAPGRQYPAAPTTHYADDVEDDLLGGSSGVGAGGYNKLFGDGYSYNSPRDRYSADDALRALNNSRTAVNPYGKVPPILRPYEGRENVPNSAPPADEGGSYMDAFVRQRRQEEKPWYKVYNLKDFRRMKKEVHLGTLGPDLDSDILRERKEKAQRQAEYAKNVMSKNKTTLTGQKPPSFPRPKDQDDIMNKRKVAVEYARSVPKPTVKPRPTQFNNYELASEKSPIARVHNATSPTRKPVGAKAGSKGMSQSSSPTHSQRGVGGGGGGGGGGGVVDKDIEELDLARMRQRYEQDKQNEAMIRRNNGSVGGSRGYYGDG